MEKKSIIILILIILSGIIYYNYVSTPTTQKITINRIIDGDTIELENKLKVRLKGINTPEKNMPNYQEAKQFLEDQIQNKQTSITHTGTDRYGRILGHIYIENQNINEQILKQGLAHLYYYEKDSQFNKLKSAETFARNNQLGIWQKSNLSNCLQLIKLDYYDKGDDHETLTLQNNCNQKLNIIIKDDATHIYKEKIPMGIYTKTFQNIFNDNGDTLYIWDEQGKIIIFHRY
jgi:micrococcal nuclease